MADQQELAVREKREATTREERTVPGRFYLPLTDVGETEEELNAHAVPTPRGSSALTHTTVARVLARATA